MKTDNTKPTLKTIISNSFEFMNNNHEKQSSIDT
jgi:hypothetical protein